MSTHDTAAYMTPPPTPPGWSNVPLATEASTSASTFDRVLSMFRRQKSELPAATAADHRHDDLPGPGASGGSDAAVDDPNEPEFNRLLERTLGSNQRVTAGHVQLIGLERLRDYLGQDWEAEKQKVHAAADCVIRNHLIKGDIHKQIDDVSFVVVFASLHRDAARLKCAMIADAIVRRLIGSSEDLSFVNVRTAVLKEDGKVVLQQVNDLEGLVSYMLRQTPEELSEPAPSWPASDPRGRRRRLDWCLKTVEYRFQPLWCASRGIIFVYRLLPTRLPRSGRALFGYRLLPQPDDTDAILELDLRCARHAVQELGRSQESGLRHLIGLRLHFETAASVKRRLLVVNVLQSAPEHLRQNLVCSIVEVPDGLSQTKLNDIVGSLRPFFRVITATLRSTHHDLRFFAEARIHAVGVDVPSAQGLLDIAGLEMRRFCKEAHRLSLRTYLNNLSNPTLVRHVLALGFDYLDGDAIAGMVERPAGILNLDAEDLLL